MNPTQNSSNFSGGGGNVDVPPIPMDPNVVNPPPPKEAPPPMSAMPLTPPPVAPVPPPPLPMSPSPSVVTGGGRRGFPKKFIFIFLTLLFVVLGVVALLRVILPRLSSMGGGSGTIVWWGLWEDKETVQPLIDEYQTSHPGVKINYEKVAKEQYRERLINALSQGTGPDIMTIHNSWVPMFRNFLSPMPSSVMSAADYQQTFYPIIVSDMSLGTSIVGVPTGFDALGLYVNDEIFSTYGKTVPPTWNEIRDTAIELTIREGNTIKQAGIAMGETSNVDHWPEILALLMFQNGASLSAPTSDLAQGALDFFTVFSAKDKVWDETQPNSTLAFANGKLAMLIAPSWRAHEIKEINPTLKFRVVPVPQLPKNNPSEPDITYATYWANSVSSKSKSQDVAWEFLKFMSTTESYEKLYASASKLRAFGQPYPRIDMRTLVSADPLVSGFLSLAGNAKSWYLVSRTWDGETGINSKLNKYFETAINSVSSNGRTQEALNAIAPGITDTLAEYGLATPRPTVAPK